MNKDGVTSTADTAPVFPTDGPPLENTDPTNPMGYDMAYVYVWPFTPFIVQWAGAGGRGVKASPRWASRFYSTRYHYH